MSHEAIPQQTEDIALRPIAWTLAAIALAIVVCGVIVWALDAFQLAGGGRSGVMELSATSRDSAPPAQPFSLPSVFEAERAATRSELAHWTWADREHAYVVVPVDVAIDRYLAARGVQ